MSKFVLYFPDITLSYFNNLSWSVVSKGFGIISKKLAEISANFKGKGINNLFLFIDFKIFVKISLKVSTSGPIHSIVSPVIFFSTIS